MKRLSRATVSQNIEFVYAALALFALTQGPVYRMWSSSASQVELLPNPSVPHVYFATFVVVQAPALMLFVRRCDLSWLSQRSNQAFFVFIGWLGLSVTWSTFARHSFPEFIALVTTSGFGLYLASSFSFRKLWWVIASSMAIGVAVSWISIMRLWDGAVNFQEDYWIGIYYNRNSLAPVTAIAIIASFALAYHSWFSRQTQRPRQLMLTFIAAAALTSYAVIELWNTESQTSPFAMAVAVLVCAAWVVLRTACTKIRAFTKLASLSAPVILILASIATFFTLRLVGGLQSLPSETTTLNLRRSLWSLSWSGFLEKPWQGWGWMAAWQTSDFFKQGNWWAVFDTEWSHNGYHDLLLGGGVLAGATLSIYLWSSTRAMSLQPWSTSIPRMLLIVFVLAAATQESFFIGSHFLWALLVAALAAGGNERSLVNEQHASDLST